MVNEKFQFHELLHKSYKMDIACRFTIVHRRNKQLCINCASAHKQ